MKSSSSSPQASANFLATQPSASGAKHSRMRSWINSNAADPQAGASNTPSANESANSIVSPPPQQQPNSQATKSSRRTSSRTNIVGTLAAAATIPSSSQNTQLSSSLNSNPLSNTQTHTYGISDESPNSNTAGTLPASANASTHHRSFSTPNNPNGISTASHSRNKSVLPDLGHQNTANLPAQQPVSSTPLASVSAIVRAKLAASAQIAPGGVLAHEKWYVLEEGRDVDMDAAAQLWPGSIETAQDGQTRRFVIDINALPKAEVKRQEVIHELITTEREYVRDLKLLIDLFLRSMRQMNILPEEGLQTVFSNTEALLELNNRFLQQLCNRKSRDFGIIQEIGDVFVDFSEDFRIYNVYCSNHTMAIEYLQSQKSNRDVGIFLQFCALKPECRGMDLTSFLLKPIQRICKYPLLLRELIKNTHETHTDQSFLKEAMKEITDVVDYVNESSRRMEQHQKMLVLISKLEFSDTLVLPRDPERTLICESTLVKTGTKTTSLKMLLSAQRWCVLFRDCLVIAKPSLFSGGRAQVNAIYSIWSVSIANVPDSDRAKHVIEFNIEGKKQMQFAAASEKEKKMWIDGVAQALQLVTKSLAAEKEKKRPRKMTQLSDQDPSMRRANSDIPTPSASLNPSGDAITASLSAAGTPPLVRSDISASSQAVTSLLVQGTQVTRDSEETPPGTPRRARTEKTRYRRDTGDESSSNLDVSSNEGKAPSRSGTMFKTLAPSTSPNPTSGSATDASAQRTREASTKTSESRTSYDKLFSSLTDTMGRSKSAVEIDVVQPGDVNMNANTTSIIINHEDSTHEMDSVGELDPNFDRNMTRSHSSSMIREEEATLRRNSRRAGYNSRSTNTGSSAGMKIDGKILGDNLGLEKSGSLSKSTESRSAFDMLSALTVRSGQDQSSKLSLPGVRRRKMTENFQKTPSNESMYKRKHSESLGIVQPVSAGNQGFFSASNSDRTNSMQMDSKQPIIVGQSIVSGANASHLAAPQRTHDRASSQGASSNSAATGNNDMQRSDSSSSVPSNTSLSMNAQSFDASARRANIEISGPVVLMAQSSSQTSSKPSQYFKTTEERQNAMSQVRAKFAQNTGTPMTQDSGANSSNTGGSLISKIGSKFGQIKKMGSSGMLKKSGSNKNLQKSDSNNQLKKSDSSNKLKKSDSSNKLKKSDSSNQLKKNDSSNQLKKNDSSNQLKKQGSDSNLKKQGSDDSIISIQGTSMQIATRFSKTAIEIKPAAVVSASHQDGFVKVKDAVVAITAFQSNTNGGQSGSDTSSTGDGFSTSRVATKKGARPPAHTVSGGTAFGIKTRSGSSNCLLQNRPTELVTTHIGSVASSGNPGSAIAVVPTSPTIQALIQELTRDRSGREDVFESSNIANTKRAPLIKDKISELQYNLREKVSGSGNAGNNGNASGHSRDGSSGISVIATAAPVRPSMVKLTGVYNSGSSGAQSSASNKTPRMHRSTKSSNNLMPSDEINTSNMAGPNQTSNPALPGSGSIGNSINEIGTKPMTAAGFARARSQMSMDEAKSASSLSSMSNIAEKRFNKRSENAK